MLMLACSSCLGGLVNLSTRATVGVGERVMIAGFITTGNETVVVRALGPTLALFGIANALLRPVVQVYDVRGQLIQPNVVVPPTLTPPAREEMAYGYNLPEGDYTAILSSEDNGSGVALVEIYEL